MGYFCIETLGIILKQVASKFYLRKVAVVKTDRHWREELVLHAGINKPILFHPHISQPAGGKISTYCACSMDADDFLPTNSIRVFRLKAPISSVVQNEVFFVLCLIIINLLIFFFY